MQRNVGEQRWRSHESARLPPMWSGIDAGLVPDVGRVCCWFSPSFKGPSPGSPQNQYLQIPTRLGPVQKPANTKVVI